MYLINYCANNTCLTDLHLNVEPQYISSNGSLIVGTSGINVTVSLNKSGDRSYGTTLYLAFPKYLAYHNQHYISGEEVQCSLQASDEDNDNFTVSDLNDLQKYGHVLNDRQLEQYSVLICTLGQPLIDDTGFETKVTLKAIIYYNGQTLSS